MRSRLTWVWWVAVGVFLLGQGCEPDLIRADENNSEHSGDGWDVQDSSDTGANQVSDGGEDSDIAPPDGDAPDDENDEANSDDPPEPVECGPLTRNRPGAPSASASWRFGGGTGYPDKVVLDEECMTVVRTASELEAALSSAQPGDVVYVADDARIDLTGRSKLCIPQGIWLASGRGHNGSPGGEVYTTEAARPMLRTCGGNIRITGLRLLGNDPHQCPAEYYSNSCPRPDNTGGVNCRDCTTQSIGVFAENHDNIEFDNNEMAGWAHAAIYARNTKNLHVHHNYIHHTQRQGLGYGVVLMRGGSNIVDVLVEWNRFNYNRHAIAGSGEPGQSYVARNNLVLEHANGHVFDMHGSNENVGDNSPWAGTHIEVYDNTVLVDDHYTMVIRGRPEEGAWLYNNCLRRANASAAALQRNYSGRMYVDTAPGGQTRRNSYNQGLDDCERLRWCYAPGGDGPWTYGSVSRQGINNLVLHDFDGDGKADVFTTQNGEWRVVYGASGSWRRLQSSAVELENLRFGDFDGDGKTDIFSANGSVWRVSYGGTGSWQTLRNATERVNQLVIGDFNGDGKADVFTATGSAWRVSYGGTESWQTLRSTSERLDQLAFGDFDGDGKTDVFTTRNGQWLVSYGGTSSWQKLNDSNIGLSQLRFADLNGDGKTDIFRQTNDRWNVSWGGTSPWQVLRISSLTNSEILFGDITGDGKDDIFTTGCH